MVIQRVLAQPLVVHCVTSNAAGPTISFDAILLLIVGLSAYMAVFPNFHLFIDYAVSKSWTTTPTLHKLHIEGLASFYVR